MPRSFSIFCSIRHDVVRFEICIYLGFHVFESQQNEVGQHKSKSRRQRKTFAWSIHSQLILTQCLFKDEWSGTLKPSRLIASILASCPLLEVTTLVVNILKIPDSHLLIAITFQIKSNLHFVSSIHGISDLEFWAHFLLLKRCEPNPNFIHSI